METIQRVKRLRDEFDARVKNSMDWYARNYDNYAARIRDELDVILKDLQKCLN